MAFRSAFAPPSGSLNLRQRALGQNVTFIWWSFAHSNRLLPAHSSNAEATKMARKYLAGIDIGTTGTNTPPGSAVLFLSARPPPPELTPAPPKLVKRSGKAKKPSAAPEPSEDGAE